MRKFLPSAPAVFVFLLASACSSSPEPAAESVPHDFALSVTVLDRAGDSHPVLTRALRPARYIVEPDQVLRASVGPGSQTTTYPPAIRTLTRAQVTQLWEAVVQGGYLTGDPRRQVGDMETRTPVVVRPTALLYVAGAGRRRSLQLPLDGADAATRSLLDKLAGLAWVSQ